jgi:predicted ATP-grasp superfamily ATP-dependent carboligase
VTRAIRKLAIVGASARAAAMSALWAGYEVVAADLFADVDLARACPVTRVGSYPAGLVEWLAASDCEAWLYTGALENHPDLVDEMTQLRPLLGTAGAALREVRDPSRLQAACAHEDVAFPETRTTAEGLPLDGSWLCKTYREASGAGVWRLDSIAARERADREHAVFQRHIAGDAYAAVFVARPGRAKLLGVTRQYVGSNPAKPWQYVGSIGPVQLSDDLCLDVRRMGRLVAARFDLHGIVGVDFVVHDDRAWVVEVNPRYTASVEIMERAAGRSAILMHVPYCDQREPAVDDQWLEQPGGESPAPVHAKTIIFAPRTLRISPAFFRWMIEHTGPIGPQSSLADLPHEGEEIAQGRPVLTTFATGTKAEDCEQRLRERVAMLECRLLEDCL